MNNVNTIQMTDIELIEFIFKDFINPRLWKGINVNKHRNYYYLTVIMEFEGKYLTELLKYFEVISMESTEERCITFKLRKLV